MKARLQTTLAAQFLLLLVVASVALGSPIATVQTASNAFLKRGGAADFATLGGRTSLNAGDIVRTGAKGKANLLFLDGSQLRLNSNTSIQITSATGAGGGRQSFFRALGGQVWARMRPGSAASTRTAVAGVRGTEILLGVADDGTSTLTVIEGVVDFYNEFGAVVVNESQQSTAAPGKAPTAPITVNNPGLLIEWTFNLDFIAYPREKFWYSRNPKEAEKIANGIKIRDEDSTSVRVADGKLLFDRREYEKALSAFTALKTNSLNRELALDIGWTLLELNRLDEAEAYFLAILKAKDNDVTIQPIADTGDNGFAAFIHYYPVQAQIGLAWIELARNKPAAAQKYAQQAANAGMTSETGVVLGVAFLRQNMLDDADKMLTAAAKTEPADYQYQAKAWMALLLLARGDNAGALKIAREAATDAPDSGLARGNLSLALLFNDQSREAAKQAHRAVELNPDAAAARVALAQSLLVSGDSDEAAREAAQAVGLDSQSAQAYYVLGLSDAARRDYVHANRELKQSLKLAPDFLPAVAAMARVQTAMDRKQEATTLLTEYQAKHPQSPEVFAALGQVYYQQGNYKEAAAQYQKAVELQPKSALYQAELARLLLDDNQLNAALKAAQQAAFLAPQVGQYHALLGLIADYSNLTAYAAREYRTAIALDPQNALARFRLALKDANPRTAVNTVTQSFLFDPAISRQFFRGGVEGELTATIGNDGVRGIGLAHREQNKQGNMYLYGSEGTNKGNGSDDAPHDNSKGTVVQEYGTWLPDNKTTILGEAVYSHTENGYNGPAPVLDDREDLANKHVALNIKRRFGDKHEFWLGSIYNVMRGESTDPDSNSKLFGVFPGPFFVLNERDRTVTRTHEYESRVDFNLNDNPERRSTLTLGISYANAQSNQTQNLTVLPPVPAVPLGDNENQLTRRSTVTYAQWAQRVNSRLSFVAQLRQQSITGTFSTLFLKSPLSDVIFDETRALPSLLVNYQLDNKTALRFFASRRQQDVGFESFAPTETILSSEPVVFANGFSSNTRLYELDAERYFTPSTFGKIFLFKSQSRNLLLGNSAYDQLTVPRADKTGIGIRFEKQLAKNVFSNLLFAVNRTEADAPGTLYDGEIAPYQPRRVGRFSVNYLDPRGNKALVAINYAGGFYQDNIFDPGRPRFPSRTTVDLVLGREPSLRHEITFAVINVFDKDLIQYNGFPALGRQYQLSYTQRF